MVGFSVWLPLSSDPANMGLMENTGKQMPFESAKSIYCSAGCVGKIYADAMGLLVRGLLV